MKRKLLIPPLTIGEKTDSEELIVRSEYDIVDSRRAFFKLPILALIIIIQQRIAFSAWTIEFEVNIWIIRFLIRFDSGKEKDHGGTGDVNAGVINDKKVIVNTSNCMCSGMYENMVSDPNNPNKEDIIKMIDSCIDDSIRFE